MRMEVYQSVVLSGNGRKQRGRVREGINKGENVNFISTIIISKVLTLWHVAFVFLGNRRRR